MEIWIGTNDQIMELAHAQFGENITVTTSTVVNSPGWFRVCRFDDSKQDDERETIGWVNLEGQTFYVRNYKNSRYFDTVPSLTWKQLKS